MEGDESDQPQSRIFLLEKKIRKEVTRIPLGIR